ncbi:class I SAM-dependent methyltransferase [Leptospira terpstrae]|uniref:C-methyltransferase C-terminal domain protein n=1 Tax=Leptospira terpstrae serovar Hualin str. LT 11-33 = ATCC 700639 TaxID=1257025 RepID=N1VSG1_9LEPT|nr:class I SAM-dependent methyltransferase [Leptospira terpstrae]EMY61358.1 C-methyltransferase C-terminal domain protein [Leptospira terpstrae serovar Hualin str. LT 11-33 = ATCC 700639]
MKCRHCESNLTLSLIDLGTSPPSNAYLTEAKLHEPEKWFPLRVLVCENCWLVQTEDFASANELFDSEYAYFSGYSSSWLEHAKNYVTQMISRFNLNKESHVVEIAANDGYLLQYVKAHDIPCTGIEPTTSTANAAREKGIDIVEDFFGVKLAKELVTKGKQADLTAANNVLAHVPDINDFVSGFSILLKPDGISTFEFPHLMRLVNENQFDTIYHEHFSYLSFIAVNRIFSANGLNIFDVEELPTHGGSLRIFAQRSDTGKRVVSERVAELLKKEQNLQMNSASYYHGLQLKAEKVKDDLLEFLIKAKKQGKKVAAYGAAAKGNTLLNFAGIRHDLISFVVDKNPSKQGKYLPGSRIPIVDEEVLKSVKPDYVIILPWNLKSEVIQQLNASGEGTHQYVIAIPDLTIS